MKPYKRLPVSKGCIDLESIIPRDVPFVIRCQKEDIICTTSAQRILLVESEGQVEIIKEEEFKKKYDIKPQAYNIPLTYFPRIKISESEQFIYLKNYTRECIEKTERVVRARALHKDIKLFNDEEDEYYKLGKIGDYLVVCQDREEFMYISTKDHFERDYKEIEE